MSRPPGWTASPRRPMRPLAAVVMLLGCSAAPARAQLTAGAGIEYFDWHERTSPVAVSESGPLLSLWLGLAQRRDAGLRLAYRGHGGIGIADYRGSFLTAPRVAASATTVFAAMTHQGQLRYRFRGGPEAVASLDFDWWHRQLSASQQEDYLTLSLAPGLEWADRDTPGWSGGGGLRLPLTIREDAHFTELGFEENPTLEPGKRAGLFGHLRYRFGPRLSCALALDHYALGRSPQVSLRTRGGSSATAFQPATTVLILGARLEYGW